ncbi:MAG: transcription termination/antitermination NusG family protein [Kiritimatiellia bacterium]|nr:transcription termination/antitermination NusG family protein [Kiritimatiellia bacterium]
MKEIDSLRENGGGWHVLHVRPRCEKKVAAYCIGACLQSYLPLRLERKKYQRRRVEVWKPVFPGYVFACFRPEQRISVLQSGQIARILEVKDQIKFINEIEQIRKAIGADPGLQACPAISAGMTARITEGPFQGLEGIVVKFKGGTRVILNVDIIGQGVAIEIDEDVLEGV